MNQDYTTLQDLRLSATDAIQDIRVADKIDSRDEFNTSNVSVPSNLVATEIVILTDL